MNPDRRWDDETRTRLQQIAKGYADFTKDHDRFAHRVYVILAALIVVQFIAGGVSFALLNKIQDSRREVVRRSCNDTNERHDRVLISIDIASITSLGFTPRPLPAPRLSDVPADQLPRLLLDYDRDLKALLRSDEAKRSPRYQRIVEGQGSTRKIIDALVPRDDCDARVRRFIG